MCYLLLTATVQQIERRGAVCAVSSDSASFLCCRKLRLLLLIDYVPTCYRLRASNFIIMTSPARKGIISIVFCPSVHPSVVYIANNLRTQRLSVPKFGRKVPHL